MPKTSERRKIFKGAALSSQAPLQVPPGSRHTSSSAHCGLAELRISITRCRELNFWLLKSAGMACSCSWTKVQSTLGASPVLLPGLLPSARAGSLALRTSDLDDFMLGAPNGYQLLELSCVTLVLRTARTLTSLARWKAWSFLFAYSFALHLREQTRERTGNQRCPLHHSEQKRLGT